MRATERVQSPFPLIHGFVKFIFDFLPAFSCTIFFLSPFLRADRVLHLRMPLFLFLSDSLRSSLTSQRSLLLMALRLPSRFFFFLPRVASPSFFPTSTFLFLHDPSSIDRGLAAYGNTFALFPYFSIFPLVFVPANIPPLLFLTVKFGCFLGLLRLPS